MLTLEDEAGFVQFFTTMCAQLIFCVVFEQPTLLTRDSPIWFAFSTRFIRIYIVDVYKLFLMLKLV
jgi:hypothetical protein